MGTDAGMPRRSRILAAAEMEFGAHGYSGARVGRIAARAGVNKQLLFHYFGSKEGLYRAAVASVVSRLAPDPPLGAVPTERLRELIARLDSAASQNPALLGPGVRADAGELAALWRRRAVQSARQILQDGQRTGHVRDDIDLETVAKLVVVASFGIGAVGGQAEQTADVVQRDQLRDILVRTVIDYCAWR